MVTESWQKTKLIQTVTRKDGSTKKQETTRKPRGEAALFVYGLWVIISTMNSHFNSKTSHDKPRLSAVYK